MVQLKEPPKEEVLAWKPGQPIPRETFVVVWKRRGITDLNSVFCFVNTPGYFGNAEEEGRRLFRIECGQSFGAREDADPISGQTVVWEADAKKVLRVIDTEIAGSLRELPGPITMQQLVGQNRIHIVTAARVSRASQADQRGQRIGATRSGAGGLADVGPRL